MNYRRPPPGDLFSDRFYTSDSFICCLPVFVLVDMVGLGLHRSHDCGSNSHDMEKGGGWGAGGIVGKNRREGGGKLF